MDKTLLEKIAGRRALKNAWNKLNKGNKKSRGISAETIESFSNSLDSNIDSIIDQLDARIYKFSPVRGTLIAKSSKGYRPLRIAEIRDRLVLKAIALELDDILTEKFKLNNECSFAYRKGKNIEQAIKQMVKYYLEGYRIILEADISKFFDTVDRTTLLQVVTKELPDQSINDLIKDGLSQEVGNLHELEDKSHFEESISGIPQGNALSPLMANIYLHSFDQRMIDEGFRMIRYADDFIVMCKSYADAKRALEIAKEELEIKLHLKLHELTDPKSETGKTRIVDPRYHKFSFLSIKFNGREVWVHEKKIQELKQAIKAVTLVNEQTTVLKVLKQTNNILEGWLSAFKFVDVDRNIEDIDDYINHQLYLALEKLNFRLKNLPTTSPLKTVRRLDTKQRRCSGVSLSSDFLSSLDRNKITIDS